MTNNTPENILIADLCMKWDENEETALFPCPFSGQDTANWVDETPDFPKELVLYHVNLLGYASYIKESYIDLFESGPLDEDNDDFEEMDPSELYLSKLPKDKKFTYFTVYHPDDVEGDFTIYIYEGHVSKEFIKEWSS
jgi:hypothetical protein